MKFLKQNWKMLLLILVAAFLVWLLFRSCKSVDHSAEYRRSDSLALIIKIDRAKWIADSSDFAERKYVDSVEKEVLKRQLIIAKAEFYKADAKVSHYITVADSLREILDTVAYVKNCDSLIIEVEGLQFSNRELQTQYEETLQRMSDEVENHYVILANQQRTYNQLYDRTLQVLVINETLEKELRKAEKGRKFNKTLNRVLAAAVLVLGGAVLVK
jgi:hypothetical protein